MILAKRIPRAEQDRRWRAYYADRIQEAARKHENRRVRNMELVRRFDEGRKYEFRGRHYGVPPVPWPLALRVLEVQHRFAALAASGSRDLRDWAAVYRAVAKLFKKVCRPLTPLRRILWPLTRSPVYGATPREVGNALGFFCRSLALDATESQTGAPPLGTLPTTSPASSPATPDSANGAGPGPQRVRSRGRRS